MTNFRLYLKFDNNQYGTRLALKLDTINLLNHFGPERILYGTDYPVSLAKGRSTCLNNSSGMDFRQANPFIDAIPQTGTIEVSYMVYEFALSLIEAARELGYSSVSMCRLNLPIPVTQEFAYAEAELLERRRLDVGDLLVLGINY